ncbi:hypothetical protein [Streptomyces canus]|uniref:hypothetical protein n=1 Tax=Streptomyces canus TaxID=58343 RepID=UPI0036EC911A
MTNDSDPKARWSKDEAGALFAAISAFLFVSEPVQDAAGQLNWEYAHTAAALLTLAVAFLAHRVGLRAMRKLP